MPGSHHKIVLPMASAIGEMRRAIATRDSLASRHTSADEEFRVTARATSPGPPRLCLAPGQHLHRDAATQLLHHAAAAFPPPASPGRKRATLPI